MQAKAQDAVNSAQTKTIQLAGANASLNHGLDAKKARQGDAVTAKLQNGVKISDSQELPKNTVLLGHIDQVQSSQNKSDSSVEITFDKAQLKDGQQLPIKATIIAIAPPANEMMNQAQGSAASAPMPSSNGSAGAGTQSAPSPSASAPSMPSTVPDQSQQQSQQGVSGVELKSDIHQQDSGTFTSKGKNVRLEDGTQMQMALAVIPPNTQVK
jgi:hypothetical protein